jgi:serine/threonine-protein kinase
LATVVEPDDVTNVLDPVVVRAKGRVGQVLKEKWRLDVLLGVGGMAAVYAATHRNGSRVAVKILHSELSVNPQVRERFLREGYAANAVGHDGAVKVSDDDVAEDGSLFLVTELLDGETLEDRRTRAGGRLGEDETLSIADQVLDVLVAAHAKGVIHRDLKPENVFLTRDGRAKVLDFGIARLRELSTVSRATKTGTSMGTPAFMAPEQARGLWEEVDARSDLWAIGATMFVLLSGADVHSGRTTNEVLIAAATKPAPHLESVAHGVSPAVARVIDKALAFEKERRFLDAARMQEAVRAAYHDRTGSPISTAPKLTVPPSVTNKTLPSAAAEPIAPGAPTTNGAVAHSRPGDASPGALAAFITRLPRPRRVVLWMAGGVLAGLICIAVAWVSSGGSSSPATSATSSTPTTAMGGTARSASAVVSALAPTPASASSEPSMPPAVAPTDLPAAPATTAEAPKRAPSPKAIAVPAAAPAQQTAKPNCTPPYRLDPGGKKVWKPECL